MTPFTTSYVKRLTCEADSRALGIPPTRVGCEQHVWQYLVDIVNVS